MRTLHVTLVLLLLAGLAEARQAPVPPPDVAPASVGAVTEMPESLRLKVALHLATVENAQLRSALAKLQTDLDTVRLTAERAGLEATLRATLQPVAGSAFNWQTLTFDPPKELPQ